MATNPANHATLEVTDTTFLDTIQRNQPVLIDFWAAWCGPCQMLAPIIDDLAQETTGQFIIGKLDVDQNPSTPTQYDVRSIPTLIVFKQGKEVERLLGGQHTKETLRTVLLKHAE